MKKGVLSLRMSALHGGLAAAAAITALVLAATTGWGAAAATIVLGAAVLGYVAGRAPAADGAAWALLLGRLVTLVGTGVLVGGALMVNMAALRDVVEREAPSVCLCESALCRVPRDAGERAAIGAAIGVRLAAIVWILSLPGGLGRARRRC